MRSPLTLIVFLFWLVMVSCEKYPQGGDIYKTHKKIRGGWNDEYYTQWLVKKFEVNGMDSTYYFRTRSQHKPEYSDYDVQIFGKARNKKEFSLQTEVFKLDMRLSDDKKELIVSSTESSGNAYRECTPWITNIACERNIFIPVIDGSGIHAWTIEKLTKEDMILSSVKGNKYLIVLHRWA